MLPSGLTAVRIPYTNSGVPKMGASVIGPRILCWRCGAVFDTLAPSHHAPVEQKHLYAEPLETGRVRPVDLNTRDSRSSNVRIS